ncbi:EF-hand calcium-binding domain-containing protein 6-like isoform X2 [Babylonia areolata]|uniref:EF-hand calcium-binding domain-containing protein 6-like isoform X2 n=1 Tax=Babylonia areolata TaxID=304850 RepID=UPI003FD47C26
MSQMAVSRSASHMKVGVNLPDIQHPLSRMSHPDNMDIRGVSRAGDRTPESATGRPLACETPVHPGRKSMSAMGRENRTKKEGTAFRASISVDAIPEGVEVKYGDPAATRLPVFGSRAGMADRADVPPSRASSRMSRASTQSRLEIDELEALLRDKVKNNYYEVRKRFKDNDPEGRGNVARDAFLRILVTVSGRQISQSQSQKLLERLGFKERTIIPFTDFFAHFREVPDKEYPQWMDPVSRPDKVAMSAGQVHANLRAKARQRFLDLAEMIPQMNPGGSGRVMRSEFKQMLQKMNFNMDDTEFEKLWCSYDRANEGVIDGRRFLNALGIEWRGQSGPPVRAAFLPQSARSEGSPGQQGQEERSPRRRELERKQQLNVERWLKDKFREGFFNMRKAFEDLDTEKKGIVSFDDFLEVLSQFGLRLEKSLLGSFLSRCSIQAMGKGVPYREFLHRFQDRSEAGMVHNVLTDVKHRFNNRPSSSGGESTMSALESQLINMFQRDFLALLGMFKKLDRDGSDRVSQEEFRAAVESRFNLELSDEQFEAFLDRVPMDDVGNILYARFMQQFDTRGKAPSLFASFPERVDPDAVVMAPGKVPVEGPGAHGTQNGEGDPPVTAALPDQDEDELQLRRSNQQLFKVIKGLLSKRFQEVEKAFYELDEANTRRLTQEMMYQLLRRFDIKPEISRGEIRDLWRTFITNSDRTLEYLQFIRHFGFSMRSAAFPNAKLQPPRKGDADFMMRSRKLNCASDMLQDNLRSKIDYLWDDLRKEFQGMDPFATGCVSREEFRDVLIELCVNLSDVELDAITAKFGTSDDRVSYVEFLKPFALRKQTWRHGNNMLSLLQHPQPELPITDIVEPPQKGLHGITAKLRNKLAGDWKNIRRAFRKLDVSGNGYLSLPEFRSVLKLANVLLDEEEVYHVMTEFDRDLTGKIQYEKFIEETFKPETRRSVRSKPEQKA